MNFLIVLLLMIGVSFSLPKLVSPEWLKEHLGDPEIVILEFSDSQSYLVEGHIPGARLTEKEEWRVMDEKTGALVKKPLKEYEKLFRKWGINNSSKVVLYYKGNNTNEILGAVYAYWIFHLLGHEKVALLDGGWSGWSNKGFPVSYDEPQIKEGNFRANYNPRKEIDADYLLNSIGKKPILDGRPVGHYFGISKFPAAKKYGHVPCSISLPWEWWIQRDKRTNKLLIKIPAYVDEFLKNQGIKREDEVLLFCFGGTGAAFLYMVMDFAGYQGMRVYDASKREWEYLNYPLNRYVWETFRDCRLPNR
ncbi:thiosulfate/3-mercaptopyruvate sulfurtransferase [Hydrogenivirga caldilitoris]|uniref:Thiosulfate/3-mercaptopyruvate sulfurtransferase n=1 Tax=Hydrogenivirga caldilitoris TaxID=246264 RepID=A0A497XR05_9AQUI|nr:sulfurtransferase [Hydrogenivirga caldilitoris]RLJ71338.1 thiosulfate/3-mercaptopyruvate sulfurtransferase [Hydrogenivirga caldilitoris]